MKTILKEALMSFSVTELKYFHFDMHIQFHVPDTKKNLEILKPTGYNHLIILYNLEDEPKAVQKEKITKWLTSALKPYEKEAIEFDDDGTSDEDILKMDKWLKKKELSLQKETETRNTMEATTDIRSFYILSNSTIIYPDLGVCML